MTLSSDDILTASASSDRGVLLSERTQLLAIKALQIAEFRTAWEEMSDSDWDDIDAAIGEAHAEILTLQDTAMTWQTLDYRRTSDLALFAGETIIEWQEGSVFEPLEPTKMHIQHVGRAFLTAHFEVSAGTNRSLVAKIRKNGSEIIAHYNASVDSTLQRCTISAADDVLEVPTYYELLVTVNSGSNFPSSANPQFYVTLFEFPS